MIAFYLLFMRHKVSNVNESSDAFVEEMDDRFITLHILHQLESFFFVLFIALSFQKCVEQVSWCRWVVCAVAKKTTPINLKLAHL